MYFKARRITNSSKRHAKVPQKDVSRQQLEGGEPEVSESVKKPENVEELKIIEEPEEFKNVEAREESEGSESSDEDPTEIKKR